MSWAKLDDQFHSHPKLHLAGKRANEVAGIYSRALSYCGAHQTDGFVPEGWALSIADRKALELVLSCGLWVRVAHGESFVVTDRRDSGRRRQPDVTVVFPTAGFFIEDYLHFNPSRQEVTETRKSRTSARAPAAHGRSQNAHKSRRNDVAIPDPTPLSDSSTSTVDAPPFSEELAIARLLAVVGDVDEDARLKIQGFARRLPEGSLAKVAESVRIASPQNRVGYALRALGSELKERS